MTGGREYYVIEFKDPPVLDLDRYICVPKTWTSRPFTNTTSDPTSVVVKYPLEKQGTTRSRVRKYEDYEEEWRIYIASVKYKSEKYKDALSYINLLNKSNEGFEPRSKQTYRAPSTDNNTPRNENQSYDRTTSTEPNESIPSNAQVSSAETPMNKKTGIKKKYAGKSQNKESTNDENSTQQASVIDVTIMCKSVVEELKNIKQELVGLFNNTLPMIEHLKTTVSQNSVMLEKIYTLVNKPNRPDIDNTIPTVSRKMTQNNAEGEIGNKTKTAEGNNVKEIDDSIASTSKNTTSTTAMEEEVEKSSKTVENNPATIDDPKTHDATTISKDKTVEVETISRIEGNDSDVNDDPKPHGVTIISEDEDTTVEVETVGAGIPQSTRVITTEDAPPMRNGTKRKFSDDDSNVPMKKRDGPRNHTLQNRQNDSGITLNNNTQASPVIVESIPGTNRELMIVPQELLKFVHDAYKMSLLYMKS